MAEQEKVQNRQQQQKQEGYHDAYNPLDEPVKERAYTKGNVSADDRLTTEEIPEPSFEPPSLEELQSRSDRKVEEQEQEGQEQEEPKTESSFNPKVEELPKKDQQRATEIAVDTVLDGYAKMKKWGGRLAGIPEKKYKKLIEQGKINPAAVMVINEQGDRASIDAYKQAYNEQMSDSIQLNPEFREEVRPVMIRVFQKRGIGMTDEQFLMYMFAQDLAVTGYSILQLKKQSNLVLQGFEKASENGSSFEPEQKQEQPASGNQYTREDLMEEMESMKSNTEQFEEEPFIEGEETVSEPEDESGHPFDEPKATNSNLPVYGDAELLADMERVAKHGEKNEKKSRKSKANKS